MSRRFAVSVSAVVVLWVAGNMALGRDDDSSQSRVRALWGELSDRGKSGDAAQEQLTEMGEGAFPVLESLVREDHKVDTGRIVEQVRGLDSDEWTQRRESTEQLLDMGPLALPHLRRQLQAAQRKEQSVEVRNRLRYLVRQLGKAEVPGPYGTRYTRLAGVAGGSTHFDSLRMANEVYELTPYEPIRQMYFRKLVQPMAIALYNRHLQAMSSALEAGKLAEASRLGSKALRVADLTVAVSGDMARKRLAYAKHLQDVRTRAAKLRQAAEGGDATSRRSLGELLLVELGDIEGARRQVGDDADEANEAVAVLLEKVDDEPSAEQLQRRARAAETLLQRKEWSEFGQVRLARWARDAWQASAKQLDARQAKARADALQRYRAMDGRIMQLSAPAAVMGVASTVQEFTEKQLASNLKPVSGLADPENKTARYLTPTLWRHLSPIPNTGDPWGRRAAPEEQFARGAIDFSMTCEVGKKTCKWETITRKQPPFTFVQPARRSYFYFYTEIRVDAEQLRPCLVGMDDAVVVWVNGQKVCQTERRPRSWKVAAWRGKVPLRKGLNRILIRLENLGGGAGMSFLIGAGSASSGAR